MKRLSKNKIVVIINTLAFLLSILAITVEDNNMYPGFLAIVLMIIWLIYSRPITTQIKGIKDVGLSIHNPKKVVYIKFMKAVLIIRMIYLIFALLLSGTGILFYIWKNSDKISLQFKALIVGKIHTCLINWEIISLCIVLGIDIALLIYSLVKGKIAKIIKRVMIGLSAVSVFELIKTESYKNIISFSEQYVNNGNIVENVLAYTIFVVIGFGIFVIIRPRDVF
jgi:hypothetical protein